MTKDTGKMLQASLGDAGYHLGRWGIPVHAHVPSLSVQLSWCTGCSGTKPSAPPRRCTRCSMAWHWSSPSWVSAGLGWVDWARCSPGGDRPFSAGIIAVFESHRTKGIPDMYSLHSWCGMAAFVLYLLQVRAGELLAPREGRDSAEPVTSPCPHSGSWAVVSFCSPVPPSR